jgi:hypothetical protein
MVILTASKRTTELTDVQIETWFAACGAFSPEVLNAAVIELSVSEIRWLELSDLYQACRRLTPRPYSPYYEDSGPSRLEIEGVARRLGLKVSNSISGKRLLESKGVPRGMSNIMSLQSEPDRCSSPLCLPAEKSRR